MCDCLYFHRYHLHNAESVVLGLILHLLLLSSSIGASFVFCLCSYS
jgi:hypothetical protein